MAVFRFLMPAWIWPHKFLSSLFKTRVDYRFAGFASFMPVRHTGTEFLGTFSGKEYPCPYRQLRSLKPGYGPFIFQKFAKKIAQSLGPKRPLCFCSGVKERVMTIFVKRFFAPTWPRKKKVHSVPSINDTQSVQKSLNLPADSSVYLTVC